MGSNEDRDRTRSRLEAITGGEDVPAGNNGIDANLPYWLDEPGESSASAGWIPGRWRGARVNPGRRGALSIVSVGVVAVIVAGVVVLRDRPTAHEVPPLPAVQAAVHPFPSEGDSSSPAPQPPGGGELVVSVVGLVNVNGLVRLPPGARIADAIAAAGGAKDGADLFSLNMAQRLTDGDQILVGIASTDGGQPLLGSAAVTSGGGNAAGTSAAPSAGGGKVNLNTASEQDLDTLPGVGPVTAKAIVGWRSANGKFTDIEQLGEVEGIGPSRLAKLRDLVII